MTAFQNTTVTKDAVLAELRAQVADDMLAHLEDIIFEGLPTDEAKEWPRRVLLAVTPGSDLSHVPWQFLHWLLTDSEVNPGINHPAVKDAISACADVLASLARGTPVDVNAVESAAYAARCAAWSAASAARSAAAAVESAAYAARCAAWSAAYAARCAAWSAAESAAESAAYVTMADKLIDLIKAAGPEH